MKKVTKSRNKDKKILLLILSFGFVLILLGIFGYFLSKNQTNIQEKNTDILPTPTLTASLNDKGKMKNVSPVIIKTENQEIKSILENIKQIFESTTNTIDKGIDINTYSIDWITSDGYVISSDGDVNPGLDLDFRFSSKEELDKSKSNLISSFEKIILNFNYKKNINKEDNSLYIYNFHPSVKATIYDKGNDRCVFQTYITDNDDNRVFSINIRCSDKYQENYNSQIKILRDLDIKNEIVDLSRSKIYGRYGVFMLGHGRIYAMMDANNKWNLLFKTYEYAPCDKVIANKIPKEITEDCYLDEENQYFPNPVK